MASSYFLLQLFKMGRNPVLLLLWSAFVAASFAIQAVPSTNLSYIVSTSDVLVPGSPLLIDVHLIDLINSKGNESEECVLDLKVSSEELLWHVSNWKIEVDGTPKCFLKPIKLLVPEEASLKDIHVLKVESNSCFKFSRSVELMTERKRLLVSITTNKLIYTPGDLVVIQVLVHSQELFPHLKPVNISILDSKDAPLVRWLNATSEEGVIFKEYKLPLFLKAENITIVLENYKQKVIHTVEVEHSTGRYDELFLVDVRVPRYLTLSSSDESNGQSLDVSVVSCLVSGVPLHGSVELHLSLGNKSGSLLPVMLEAGHKVISLKIEEVKEILGMKESLFGHEVQVEVKVKEHRLLFEIYEEERNHEQKEAKKEERPDERHEQVESESKFYVTKQFVVTYVDQSHVLFFTEFTPLFFKPGLEYIGQILLKEVEEKLPGRSEEEEVTVNVKHYTSNSESPREEKLTLKLKTNSVGEFSFKVPKEDTKLELEALFDDKVYGKQVKAELKELLPFSSNDGHFVQVLLNNKPPKVLVGEELKFTLESTFSYLTFQYMLFSQSLMVTSGVMHIPYAITKREFALTIDRNVSHLLRSTRLLVIVDYEGEEYRDTLQFVVEEPQVQPLQLELATKTAEPGSEVELTIKAEPFTKVFLVAIPELLVFEPKELEVRKKIAHTKLSRYLRRIRTSDFSHFVEVFCETCSTIPSVAPDTQRMINESGAIVLTDGVMSYDSSKPWPLPVHKNGTMDDLELSNLDLIKELEWWKVNFTVGHSGEEKLQFILPNESRLYTLAAFGVGPRRGLVVSEEPMHLVAAPKVLASLKHPKNIVFHEDLVLEVHLYNNQEKSVMVRVIIALKSWFWLGCINEVEDNGRFGTFDVDVNLAPKQMEVVAVNVQTHLNYEEETFDFDVEIIYEAVSYRLKSPVNIYYEGYDVLWSKNLFLDQSKSLNPSSQIDKELILISFDGMPGKMTKLIESSKRAFLQIYSHPMGPAIEHVCSDSYEPDILEERTKLWFVIAVNVLEHISNNLLFDNSAEKEECVKSVKDSVEYLLYKRRDDGSYSIHPTTPGYLWFTTLMLDALVQLRNVVSYDKLDVVKTLKWLAEQQQADGSFVEPKGVVLIRKEIEGSHNVPLTSQVVISLLEAKHYLDLPKEMEELVSKVTKIAIEYLENVLLKGDLDKDSYSLSVGSYALNLAHSEKFLEVLMKRDKLVITEGNEKCWKVGENKNAGENALSLEATSYAILTSLAMNDIDDATPYVNHVSKHMKPNGAFVGVQNTNVALRALSLFHRLHDLFRGHQQVNAEINVHLSNNETVSLRVCSPFSVGRLYFDDFNLTLSNPLKVKTSGDGILVQVLFEYNKANLLSKRKKFDVQVEVKNIGYGEIFELKVCVVNKMNTSSFFIGEVPLLTGYELNAEKVQMKHYLDVFQQNDKVYVFFNEVQPGTPTCVELKLEKYFKIGMPNLKFMKFYSAEEPSQPIIKSYFNYYDADYLILCPPPICRC